MTRRPSLFLLPVLLTLAAPATAGQDQFNLRMSAAEGTSFAYKVEIVVDVNGQDAYIRAENTMKVVSVLPTGDYTIESLMTHTTLDMGGSEQPLPDSRSETKSNAKGEILEVRANSGEAEGDAYRFPNLLSWSFDSPLYRLGDTVSIKREPSKVTGGRSSETAIKLTALEEINGRPGVKVEFEAKETSGDTPSSIKGTGWIDPTVGMMLKMEASFSDVVFPGSPMPLSGRVSYLQIAE